MTGKKDEPEVKFSKLCQDVVVDGHRFSISIVSTGQHPEWCLEVVDEHAVSHCWEATFDTDSAALEAATIAFQDEGAAGFLQPNTNVVQFPEVGSNKGAS